MSLQDPRIWTMDQTCSPFLLEFARTSADIGLCEWTVPQRNLGVIRRFALTTAALVGDKEGVIVRIVRGATVVSPTPTPRIGINLRGSLMEVREPGLGAGQFDVPGLLPWPTATLRECCIIMEPGHYVATKDGTANVTVLGSFFGWTFPMPPLRRK